MDEGNVLGNRRRDIESEGDVSKDSFQKAPLPIGLRNPPAPPRKQGSGPEENRAVGEERALGVFKNKRANATITIFITDVRGFVWGGYLRWSHPPPTIKQRIRASLDGTRHQLVVPYPMLSHVRTSVQPMPSIIFLHTIGA